MADETKSGKETCFSFSSNLSLETVREKAAQFANERNWNQFHSPRNILLALIGEVGELSEIFQWKGEVKDGLPEFSSDEKVHVGQELSDVLIYLLRLADKCEIDLTSAVLEKFKLNAKKYPVHLSSGSIKKYTAYNTSLEDTGNSL